MPVLLLIQSPFLKFVTCSDLACIFSASIFAQAAVPGRTETSTSNLVFIFLDFKGFRLMDLCVLMEFCDGSQAIGLLSLE